MTEQKPKALLVYSDRYCASTYKRCFEILNGLFRYHRNEIEAYAIHYSKLSKEHFDLVDTMLFQRLGANGEIIPDAFKKELETLMGQYRQKVRFIYDIDDLLLEQQESYPIRLLKSCHMALAPNDFLRKELEKYNHCDIIRTHVDLEAINLASPVRLDPTMIHIGWFSGSCNGIEMMKPVIRSYLKRYNHKAVVHLFCDKIFHPMAQSELPYPNIRLYPIVSSREMYSYMKSMRCVINPLRGHALYEQALGVDLLEAERFMQAKSEIKYALAGACSAPLIVNATESYRKAITPFETGFLVEKPDDWLTFLIELSEDEDQAKVIGNQARLDVEKRYSLQRASNDYLELFHNG